MANDTDGMTLDEIGFRLTQRDTTPLNKGTPLSEASREFLFGRIWKSDLSFREKRLISLTCAAISGHDMPLETHIYAALKSGDFTLDELHAFALHVAAYAGFPMGAGTEMMIQKVCAQMEKEENK
jgi:4-carboxymuconolactone decarboxylase